MTQHMQLQTVEGLNHQDVATKYPDHGYYAVMCTKGDLKILWNKNNPAEVAEAKSQFERYTKPKSQGGLGYMAFKVKENGKEDEQVREFSPKDDKYIFMPQMVGG